MLYQKGKIKNGKIIITESKQVNQNELSSDCWLIQINGLKACQECEFNNTDDCGGKAIQEKLK